MMHDRIADEGQLEDLARVDAGFGGHLLDQSALSASRTAVVIPLAARVHHHVGDPAHQIFAEADLRDS